MSLIVFGCSFTDLAWPSWSEIIAEDLGCDYENWARSGTGNSAIARRVMYRNFLGFKQDDIVIVQWTFPAREDRFIKGQWTATGSVFNEYGIYGNQFVKKYWDFDNDLINTAHARVSTELILGDKLKFQFGPIETDNSINKILPTPIQLFLQEHQPALPKFTTGPGYNGIHVMNHHPDSLYWLDWVENTIYPALGFTLKESTRTKVYEYYNTMLSFVKKTYTKSGERDIFINTFAAELSRKMNWKQSKISTESIFWLNNSKVLF